MDLNSRGLNKSVPVPYLVPQKFWNILDDMLRNRHVDYKKTPNSKCRGGGGEGQGSGCMERIYRSYTLCKCI
jgi:hypothetical protein